MKLTAKWLLLLLVTVLPLLLLMLVGFVWLWQHDLLLIWLGLLALIALASWFIATRLRSASVTPDPLRVEPAATWSAAGAEAWKKVEAIAERARQDESALDNWNNLWEIFKEVVATVAEEFHPDERDSVLEMRVPDFLKVIELLASDLRIALSDNVPGSHIITVNDVVRGQRLASRGRELYQLYRMISLGVSPGSAILRELKELATGKIIDASAREVKQWLVDAYVKKIGYYAIELYSGHTVLDEERFGQHITGKSRRDMRGFAHQADYLQQEPLRILVVGQVNTGKSSLINALFGEMKALVDAVPQTSGVTPYLLEREGIERAIILDSAGYEDSENPLRPLQEAQKEVLSCDLVVMVCSATSAARDADRQLLQALQSAFRQKTQEEPPPVIVVLTHIDQLRPFREWNPPYNVSAPDGMKAKMIRHAMEAVASDLQVELGQVVPVNLQPGHSYNIDEGLIPTMIQSFDATQRLKYLRCLKDYQDEEHWRRLWEQSKNAGKIIGGKGIQGLKKAAKKLDEITAFQR